MNQSHPGCRRLPGPNTATSRPRESLVLAEEHKKNRTSRLEKPIFHNYFDIACQRCFELVLGEGSVAVCTYMSHNHSRNPLLYRRGNWHARKSYELPTFR